MQDVEGKVAFVTGGSSGIGLGIARAFTDAGMKVVIGYRTREHADEAMKLLGNASGRAHAISVDVTNRADMEGASAAAARIFGKIHVLVNNAGIVGFAPLSGTTYDDWDWMMNVNVNGVFNGIRAFLPHIRAHGEGGQIITTASIVGLAAIGLEGSYIASKFAAVGMMEALGIELADTNIGVSVFCPGIVQSNLFQSERNRPKTLPNTAFKRDPDWIASEETRIMRNPARAMDPLRAGNLVLRGMRNNDLYILSHPETKTLLVDRHDAIMASFPDAASRRAEPLPQHISIYSAERDRRQCISRTELPK